MNEYKIKNDELMISVMEKKKKGKIAIKKLNIV